ncbi:hypothetical protein OG455_17855 [Kitasatospora sp. NBC_01287]|uniref:hypothetical protein n=1 Tax=Kitasatospora sp. NBC_01287 TaxID=2903573 RepID=UPI0022599E80|nr:hypothetical protein [Kitasatospora sp. NBC_01287]MCX4747364.1 hypothetical protein [Kitasatospora sp. NBC_01287]
MTADSGPGPEGAEQPPADDDPFAYLYRSEGGEGEGAPNRAPGVPRTSYTRPMEVGRAQYGAPPQQQGGYPPPYQQQPPRGPYGPGPESTAQLPNQQPRYAERSRPQPGEDAPRGRGKGPVIAVVAVVAAIAIGSGIALSGNDGKSGKDNAAPPAPSAGVSGHSSSAPSSSSSSSGNASASASPSPSTSADESSFSFLDGAKAQAQGASPGSGLKGSVSSDGSYLTLQQGSSATWTFTAPTAGQYKFWVHYNNTGGPVKASITVNGQDKPGGTTFKNSNAPGSDPYWSYTNVWPDLQAGSNTITVSVPGGGPVQVDQVVLTPYAYNGDYPSASGAPAPGGAPSGGASGATPGSASS